MSCHREIVIHGQWRVIGKALLLVHRDGARRRRQTRRGDLVVDAPTDILGPGLAAVRPPGVGLAGGLGQQPAMHIDPAQPIECGAQPGAFLGQEAGILLVRLPVFQVLLGMGDVPVAAEQDLALRCARLLRQALQLRAELVEETELGLLALLGTGSLF